MKNIMKIGLLFMVMGVFISCQHHKKSEAEPASPYLKTEVDDSTGNGRDITNREKTNVTQPGATDSVSKSRSNKGIGPVSRIDLPNQIDKEMAKYGKTLFDNNCAYCHRIHESATGPALGNVLERRSPEFVMNMILNTREMIEKEPIIMSLRSEYKEDMIQTNVSKEEARAIVEYLRENQ